MKRTREQIKAELMKRIEKEVDEMLGWREGSAPPNLSQIEGLIRGEESQGPVEAPKCPKCQVRRENKGKRDRVVETRLGTIRMKREYYACPEFREGFFPRG